MRTSIKGEVFSIEKEEEEGGQHSTLHLYVDDDDVWHHVITFSSYWLDDLINILNKLKEKRVCH